MPQKLFAKNVLRKIFFEDWGLKLFALVITLALWIGVTGLSSPATKRLTVPLVPNTSNNSEITSALIQEVDIVVSGEKSRVNQMTRGDLIAVLDLTDVQPGERTVSLGPDNVYVNLPQGMKLVEVAPSRIAVNVEAVIEKDLKVEPQITGQPAPGFEVYSTTSSPGNIRVRGPVSLFGTMDYVQTNSIDISGKKDDVTARQVGVTATDKKATVLNTVVDVSVRIGEKRVERSFTLPIPGAPGNSVSFVVYGPRSVLDKVKPDAIQIGWMNGNMRYTPDNSDPEIDLPPELQNVSEIRKIKSTLAKAP